MRFPRLLLVPVVVLAAPLWAQKAGDKQANQLTKQEATAGWKLLFDGKTMNGWEPHGAGSDWIVKDGALVCQGETPSWLGTVDSFSDYTLKVQFRGASSVNSGIFLRSEKTGQPHITGYELQIWEKQPAGFNTGSLVGTAVASPAKFPSDEWNRYEISAQGDHIRVVLNGAQLLDIHDSKHSAGVIGFQCQKNNHIEFRDIKILKR